MSLMRWEERLAPLDGIVAVALWVAGFIVLQGPADQPDTDSSPARALQYFTKEDGAILAGTLLFMLGTLFFLWFLGAIRTQLYTAEGGTNRLTTIAFAAGVATAISLLLMGGTQAAGAINNDHLSGQASYWVRYAGRRNVTASAEPRASSPVGVASRCVSRNP